MTAKKTSAPNILIAGAGIAGLSLAVALARTGIVPTVVERQAAWGPFGSGIQMQGNALRALDALDVTEPLLARCWASPSDRMVITDAEGAPITAVTYPRIGGSHLPAATGMRRQDLHEVLLGAFEAAGGAVRLGVSLTDLDPGDCTGGPARYNLSDGTTSEADLIAAADGIGSGLRERFFTARRRPTGFGVWRVNLDRPAGLDEKYMMMAPGLRFGIIPTDAASLYFFATSMEAPDQRLDPGRLDALVRDRFGAFGGWARPLLDAVGGPEQVVFTQAEEVFEEPPWHRGRLVLVGDAAHASTPFLSQGGAMGIEDAVVLAEEIGGAGENLESALARYAARRAPRCRLVQEGSHAAGVVGAITEPAAFAASVEALKREGQARIDRVYSELAKPL
jgi:2-polyprenyl-6-methoxyphenol hydroxylase-like FAD-dependent oxidoreductase